MAGIELSAGVNNHPRLKYRPYNLVDIDSVGRGVPNGRRHGRMSWSCRRSPMLLHWASEGPRAVRTASFDTTAVILNRRVLLTYLPHRRRRYRWDLWLPSWVDGSALASFDASTKYSSAAPREMVMVMERISRVHGSLPTEYCSHSAVVNVVLRN